jgi:hypothetical protein
VSPIRIRSYLAGPEPLDIAIEQPDNETFLEAARAAHLTEDPNVDRSALQLRPDAEESHYSLEYVAQPEGPWFPAEIRVPDEATIGDVRALFGPDSEADPPSLKLTKPGPKGGDFYFVIDVVIETIRSAAEIYGILVGGRELTRSVARYRARVPADAVRRWANTGELNDEVVAWTRDFASEWSPSHLALLLGVDRARCPEVLHRAGFRPITASGEHWLRDDILDPLG